MVVQNVKSWLGKTIVFGKIEGLVIQQEDNFLTLITKSGQKVMVPNNSHVIDISAIQNFSNSIVDESISKAAGGLNASHALMQPAGEEDSTEFCRYCGKTFPHYYQYEQHLEQEHRVKTKGAMTNDEVSDNEFENDSETEYPKTKDIAPNYKNVDDKQNKNKGILECPYCDKTFDTMTDRRKHVASEHKEQYDKDIGKSYVDLVREYSAKKGSDTSALYNNDTQYHAEPVEKNPIGDAVRDVAVDMGNRAIGGGVLHKLPDHQRNSLRSKPSDEVKPKNTLAPKIQDSGIDKTRTAYLGKQGTPIGLTDSIGLKYVKPAKKEE